MVETVHYKPEGRGFDSRCGHLNFLIDVFLLVALWPWGRLTFQQKIVPGVTPWEVKAAGAYG